MRRFSKEWFVNRWGNLVVLWQTPGSMFVTPTSYFFSLCNKADKYDEQHRIRDMEPAKTMYTQLERLLDEIENLQRQLEQAKKPK